MKCKRLLSLLLPTAVLLSGCQQVLATDLPHEDSIVISQDIESYHQTVILQTETEDEDKVENLYSITEATLLPKDSLAYGSRIDKDDGITPTKQNICGSSKGAFIQKDNNEWIPAATLDPLISSLEIYPYKTFVELSKIFAEKGTYIESEEEYKIVYSGIDTEMNQQVSDLLEQFPISNTHYDVSISLDKNDFRLSSFSLLKKVQAANGQKSVTQKLTSIFTKYNVLTKENASQKLQNFVDSHPQTIK